MPEKNTSGRIMMERDESFGQSWWFLGQILAGGDRCCNCPSQSPHVVMIMVVGYGGPKVQSFVSAPISLLAAPIFFSRHPRHGWVGRIRNRGTGAKELMMPSQGIRVQRRKIVLWGHHSGGGASGGGGKGGGSGGATLHSLCGATLHSLCKGSSIL